MHDMDGELLNGIRYMYANSIACMRVKGGESKCFMNYSRVKQGCIRSTWLFNENMDTIMNKVKIGMERMRAKIYGGRKRVEITRTFVCK